MAEKDCF